MAKPTPRSPAAPAALSPPSVADDSYTPQVSQHLGDGPPPPKLPSGPDFLLKAHPERWTVMAGKVVPALAKLLIQAGTNGIVLGRDKRPKLDEVLLDQARNRWTVIPWDVGGPGTSYLRKPKGTEARLLAWEKCFSGSERIVCDDVGYAAWCEKLVERGTIAPPQPYVLERMIAQRREEAEQLEGQNGGSHRRGLLLAEIAVIEARLKRALASAAPAETEVISA